MKKVGDLKFYQCPMSCITPASWDLLRLVQETTTDAGEISCFPEGGGLNDQPPRWREAVRIMKIERSLHRQRQTEK